MWKITTLKLNQFISHLDSEYKFKNGSCDVINGINSDDEAQESNGSGKSAIVEGIIFALTGDSFRKVKAIDLIMNYKDCSEVSLSLENSLLNLKLEIIRKIEKKKSSSLIIKINDKIKSDIISVNDGNKYILSLLDIERDDLMNYFIVSKDRYVSFFSSGDTKKKEIISRFSGASLIGNVDELITSDLKSLESEINKFNTDKSKLEGQIESYNEQLLDKPSKQEFEERKQLQIVEFEKQIEDYKFSISKNDKEKHEIEKAILSTEKQLKGFDTKKIEEKISEIDNNELGALSDLKEIKSEISEFEDIISEINKSLKGLIECPKCKFEFILANKDFDVKEAKKQLPVLNEELTSLESKQLKIKSIIDNNQKLKDQYKQEIRKIKNDKAEIDSKISQLNTKVNSLIKSNLLIENSISNLNFEIEKVNEREFVDNSNLVEDKIKKLKEDILKLEDSFSETQDKYNSIQEWIFNFKKFKTFLANKSIKSIESFVNLFLSKMKTNLNIKVDGYKLLSNGTLKENIVIEVLRNGLVEGFFEKFSGGERMRIDICTILTLQKLINLNSASGGLDLIILDEIIESVDSTGVVEIINQLDNSNQTIIAITHANTIKGFNNFTTVEKKNGYSRIL